MEHKAVASAALIALKEALSRIYWYKKDTRKFIEYTVKNQLIVSTIDWENNIKYESVSQLIDRMNMRPDIYSDDLIKLLYAVSNFNDFSHFDRLKKGDKEKYKSEARSSVIALRNHCKGYFDNLEKIKKTEKAKERFVIQQKKTSDYNKKIEEFKLRYYNLTKLTNSQQRGYELESFLNDLFYFFDLSPRSSFKINGEQIDGAFTHDNLDYLLEAKWHNEPIPRNEIDIFEMEISRKLKTTLGLFVSINGFVDVITNSSIKFKSIILMDSQDLILVLDNRISLVELIMLKRRHASETGENMCRVNI